MTNDSQALATVRKTFNISTDNAERMQRFVSARKQTAFVNQALAHEFLRMEKEQKLQELSEKISQIKWVKSSESALDTLKQQRLYREQKLAQSNMG